MSMNLLLLSSNNSPYIILSIIGVLLIIIEAFLPGGVIGIVGLIILAISLMLITNTLTGFIFSLIIVLAFTGLILYFVVKLIPREKLKNSLFLFSTLNKKEGYTSSEEKKEYLGCIGVTTTILRPIGKVRFGSEVVDATALTNFIEEGKLVEVVKVDGSNIIVSERKGE